MTVLRERSVGDKEPRDLSPTASRGQPVLGLRANLGQFLLLVVINAFVGTTLGVERSVTPLLGKRQFGVESATAVLTFIATFGLAKAFANLAAGRLSDRVNRKSVLVTGWLLGVPAPVLIMLAPSWGWVVAANILLGLNQGLCWSTTVIMKIDLVGPRRRGLAMGLNEAAGYGAISLASILAGYLAAYGLRPAPFLPALGSALAGLILSLFFVRESGGHARHEAALVGGSNATTPAVAPAFRDVLLVTSFKNRALSAVSQAGLVNNLNDGLAWGLLPLFFAAAGLDLAHIALLAGIYPGVWGVAQLATGALSDRLGRKPLIVAGMWLQALALALLLVIGGFPAWVADMALLGFGTALVYPTLLAAVADVAHPSWRASATGVYRLWRDLGYVAGALVAGLLADLWGAPTAILAVAVLTFASGVVVAVRMYETSRGRSARGEAASTPMVPAADGSREAVGRA